MKQPKPRIRIPSKLAPRRSDPLQLLLRSKPLVNSHPPKPRRRRPLLHRTPPVLPLRIATEAPRARALRDLLPPEPGLLRPHVDEPPGTRMPALGAAHARRQLVPSLQASGVGIPRHGGGLATRDDPAGPHDAPHLAQRLHRVRDVLQHLVRVRDVERVVGERERVDVAQLEGDVGYALRGGQGSRCR